MKLRAALMALLILALASSATAAVTVTRIATTGGNPNALGVNETVTFRITLTNPDATSIFGLGFSARGYDEAVVDFDSGVAVSSYLNAICVGPGSCFGGLNNLAGTASGANRALAESAIGANGNRVQFALSATTTGVPNTGSADQGLDNVVGTSQFDITFRGVANGSTTIFFDTEYQGDLINLAGGATEEGVGFSVPITVPEPAAIAARAAALGTVIDVVAIRRRF